MRRTAVVAGQRYSAYREELRGDFWYACAYCGMTEAESALLELMKGFAIDHYHPRTDIWQVDDVYDNLMWACEGCNLLKSDLEPPASATAAGFRFVKIDVEHPDDHMKLVGDTLVQRTPAGQMTIEMLALNDRTEIKRMRKLRADLGASTAIVRNGLRHLSAHSGRLGRLSQRARCQLIALFQQFTKVDLDTTLALEELAARAGCHPAMEPAGPTAVASSRRRRSWLKQQQAVHAGAWRGRDRR